MCIIPVEGFDEAYGVDIILVTAAWCYYVCIENDGFHKFALRLDGFHRCQFVRWLINFGLITNRALHLGDLDLVGTTIGICDYCDPIV